MDALTMITDALGAGALQAATAAADDAVATSYQRLKSLVSRIIGADAKGAMVLAEYEKEPEIWRLPLKKLIIEKGAHLEEDVLVAAAEVMNLINESKNISVKQTGDHSITNISSFHAPVSAEGSVFGTSIVVTSDDAIPESLQ